MQEYWETGSNPPLEECLRRVASSDVLIIAVAHRFGWIPPGHQKSITWIECEEAVNRGKKVLVYVISADYYEFPVNLRDSDRLAKELATEGRLAEDFLIRMKGLQGFKEWLRARFVPHSFTNAENLGQLVEMDLIRWAQAQDLSIGSFVNQRDGTLMLRVPAGSFVMGSSREGEDEAPERSVEINEFYISKYPVTARQYGLFTQQTGYQSVAVTGSPEHPVVGVTWEDARAYCRWAQLRLPNESQWEKAARGIDGRIYPWGNFGPVETRANCRSTKVDTTTSVTEFPGGASPHGCIDMAGNTFEWCQDHFSPEGTNGEQTDRAEADDRICFRTVRGGAWNDVADRCRCSCRGRRWQQFRFNNVGFRVVFSGLTEEMADGWFGANNWFCYPDRRTGLGVTKLPKLESVPELIDYVEADEKIYDKGECSVSGIGAHVELRLPLGAEQTPSWQAQALRDWVSDRKNDHAPLTRDRLNRLFGTRDWSRRPDLTFVVDVNLPEPFEIRYPVTSARDFDKARYGAGQTCPSGLVRVSLAGDMPEEYVSGALSPSVTTNHESAPD
jgi:serine/threonine-protein kinase